MVMHAGRLDRRVSLQSRTLTQDAQGQNVETWSTLAQVWARKVDAAGREYFAAQGVQAEANSVFEIRYRSDVTVLHRLVYDGLQHDIVRIEEIGRREGQRLFCRASVP